MSVAEISSNYLIQVLEQLIEVPSPAGLTDDIVHFVGEELRRLDIPFELTRRGTILPLKSSGHIYHSEIDTQPIGWDQVELRIDEHCESQADLVNAGFNVGDFVAIDPNLELSDSGFIISRHLDDRAGVASVAKVTM